MLNRGFSLRDQQNVTVELARIGDSGRSPAVAQPGHCLEDKEVCQLGSLCGTASDTQDLQYEARLLFVSYQSQFCFHPNYILVRQKNVA